MTHLCYHCNKNHYCFYTKYIINNVKINEFDKIFNYYISTHNKKFDFYYIDCEFEILSDNNYTTNIEIIIIIIQIISIKRVNYYFILIVVN